MKCRLGKLAHLSKNKPAADRGILHFRTDRPLGYLRETYLPEQGARYGIRAAFSIDHDFVTAESDRWFLPRFTHGAADVTTIDEFEAILKRSAE